MSLSPQTQRALGTMIAHGFPTHDVRRDLQIARRIGATVVEALPDWKNDPDPRLLASLLAEASLAPQSVHGSWGRQSVRAERVDLGSTDPNTRQASVDDLKHCLDWTATLGARVLVVHPGVLSNPDETARRQGALQSSILALADQARGTGVVVGVENMPPGVHPGSRMLDLARLVEEINRVEVGLVLDTGHAHMVSSPSEETRAAGRNLASTHVHDNSGRSDLHLVPSAGTISWSDWARSLDEIAYTGPIMLECIRELRHSLDAVEERLRQVLATLIVVNPLPRGGLS